MEVGKDLEVMLWYWNVHDYNHEIALLRVLRKTTESSNQHGYLAMLHLADSLQECNYQHNSASSSKYAYTLGDSGLIFSHFGLHVSQNVFNHHWIYWISSGIFENLRVRSGCMRFWQGWDSHATVFASLQSRLIEFDSWGQVMKQKSMDLIMN